MASLSCSFSLGFYHLACERKVCRRQLRDDELGMLPYQSYHGGDLDSVSLSTGSLSIDLPFAIPSAVSCISLSIFTSTTKGSIKESTARP